jgi:hypothetical protein
MSFTIAPTGAPRLKPKPLANMIAAGDRIVTGMAENKEAVRRRRGERDA